MNNNICIGINKFRNQDKPIYWAEKDRTRHFYMVGKTGVGKSTLFQNMCLQDIENDNGVCFIDPHGDSVEWLLKRIPKRRIKDVLFFNPGDLDYPMGLNLLEFEDEFEKDFLVNETIEIFYKLFDPERVGIIGPQFEHWLRNAALTAMSGNGGGTLIDIPKLFVDKNFREEKCKELKDDSVIDFWNKQMKSTSDFHKSEMLNYFMSKFGPFTNNTMMRNIIGQKTNSIEFDKLMNNKNIVLIDLSKGKIGEINSHLLGLILVSRLQVSVMKRAKETKRNRVPFYLYVDEFQNFVTDSFEALLSESRKYNLSIHLANQYLRQIPTKIRASIFGNVGTMISFEVGSEDAKILAEEFYPITEMDLLGLERFNFYIKLMINGKTSIPFSGITLPPKEEPRDSKLLRNKIKDFSNLYYTWPKEIIENSIKYNMSIE